VSNKFDPNKEPTIGAAFLARNNEYKNRNLKFHVNLIKKRYGTLQVKRNIIL